jgi:predicted transcriptional regulator YdeE
MHLKELQSIALSGLFTRTSNQDEMSSSSARIGDLWAAFYSQQGSKLTEKSNVYGVYTDYESDFSGKYTVFAAADTFEQSDELTTVTLQSGLYAVFSAEGEIPGVVIELWGHIWEYFNNTETCYERAYTTDFEHFTSHTSVDIYIAVKNK